METSSAALVASRPLVWPLHEALLNTPAGAERTRAINAKAPSNYHPIAAVSLDALVCQRDR